MKRLLTKESSHFDAGILNDRESFKRAWKLYSTIDLNVDVESGVRHIAGLNKLVFKIQLDDHLMEERRSVKFAINKMFELQTNKSLAKILK